LSFNVLSIIIIIITCIVYQYCIYESPSIPRIQKSDGKIANYKIAKNHNSEWSKQLKYIILNLFSLLVIVIKIQIITISFIAGLSNRYILRRVYGEIMTRYNNKIGGLDMSTIFDSDSVC